MNLEKYQIESETKAKYLALLKYQEQYLKKLTKMDVQEFKCYIQGVLDAIPEEEKTPILVLIKNAVDKLKSDNMASSNTDLSIKHPGTF